MRFKLDENMSRRVAVELERLGHDADTAVDEGLAGKSDSQVATTALAERRILISLDLDFSVVHCFRCTKNRIEDVVLAHDGDSLVLTFGKFGRQARLNGSRPPILSQNRGFRYNWSKAPRTFQIFGDSLLQMSSRSSSFACEPLMRRRALLEFIAS